MVSTFTANKHFEEPGHNDYIDTWDVPVNADWAAIDTAFGGYTNLNATAVAGTVTLTSTQYRPPMIFITGTVTSDINYQLPSGVGGVWMVNCLASTGAHTITFSSAAGGDTVTVKTGTHVSLWCDGANFGRSDDHAEGTTYSVQYNNAGLQAGNSNFTYDGSHVGIGLGGAGGTALDMAGTLRIRGGTSGYVDLRAANVSSNPLFFLPASDGTSGQLLQTNGLGQLSWSSVTAAGVTSFSGGSTGLTPSSPTGGGITLGGTLAVTSGGTGATTAAGAQTNLGVPSITGGGASGTWSISVSGNSATSTLATTATTANALNTGNDYQVNSIGVGTSPAGSAGDVRAIGNVTAYYSDDRLKTRLGNIEHACLKLKTLTSFYYEANETAQKMGYKPVRDVGLSAQQVQAVMPEVVVPAPIDDRYLTIRYERLMPVVIAALNEIYDEIQHLKGSRY